MSEEGVAGNICQTDLFIDPANLCKQALRIKTKQNLLTSKEGRNKINFLVSCYTINDVVALLFVAVAVVVVNVVVVVFFHRVNI